MDLELLREGYGLLLREAVVHRRTAAKLLQSTKHPSLSAKLEDRYRAGVLDGVLDTLALLKEAGVL